MPSAKPGEDWRRPFWNWPLDTCHKKVGKHCGILDTIAGFGA